VKRLGRDDGRSGPYRRLTSLCSLRSPLNAQPLGDGVLGSHRPSAVRVGTAAIALLTALLAAWVDAQTFTEFQIPTPQSRPLCITGGPDGNLWFTELEGNRVGRITSEGVITEFPLPTPNSGPAGITSAYGSIWLAESRGNKVARVLADGTIQEFLIPKQRFYPGAITTGADGTVWIAGSRGIGRVSRSGSVVLFEFQDSEEIRGIAPGPAKTIWFTDSSAGRITALTFSGKIKKRFSAYRPDQIAASPTGNMWFTMIDGDGIARITPAGEREDFQLTRSAPAGLVADHTSTIWVSDWIWNTIIRVTPGGEVSRYPVPTEKGRPAGITVGPDGNIWFVEGIANKVGRLVFGASVR
jgi:streptogramin lyase